VVIENVYDSLYGVLCGCGFRFLWPPRIGLMECPKCHDKAWCMPSMDEHPMAQFSEHVEMHIPV